MNRNCKNHGQSLIESVITIGIVILLVTGLIVGTTASLKYAENSKTRDIATNYAQDGLSVARRARDAGWTSFSALVPGDTTETMTDERFTRTLTYAFDTNGSVVVTSKVTWIERGVTKEIELQTTLTNWK